MTNPLNLRSEKGIALIVVLLLLGVMAALTSGLALNGQTEVQMSANETYYAGARAAAEAGMNRAVTQIIGNTTVDLMTTRTVPTIGNGPFTLNSQYTYRYELLDDDDPSLYPNLTAAQLNAALAQMGENGNPNVDNNTRMIVRAIGTGPKSSTVTVSRVLSSIAIPSLPTTRTVISNPALLVNGNVTLAGSSRIQGLRGNVHANGNVYGNGNPTVTGDITATGTVADSLHPGGLKAGNMPAIAVPEIKASDYRNLADFVLKADGTIKLANGTTACTSGGSGTTPPKCPTGWSFSGGTWSSSGAMPSSATYYVEGNVAMKGTGNSPVTSLSVIAEGSMTIEGNGKFRPENGAGIQFVTNGDFTLLGTVDADDTTDFDGQIMVREQMKVQGNAEFQGRIMVENRPGASNACPAGGPFNGACRRGTTDTLTENEVSGNMTLTYNGHLNDIVTTIVTPGGATTYTNNISGWIEQ
jgi:type II secretory pathway pseudopilin PulG/cytoskeletal protein CcmA (bactofilin family)